MQRLFFFQNILPMADDTTKKNPSKKNKYILERKKTQTAIIMNVNKLSRKIKKRDRKGKIDRERERIKKIDKTSNKDKLK